MAISDKKHCLQKAYLKQCREKGEKEEQDILQVVERIDLLTLYAYEKGIREGKRLGKEKGKTKGLL